MPAEPNEPGAALSCADFPHTPNDDLRIRRRHHPVHPSVTPNTPTRLCEHPSAYNHPTTQHRRPQHARTPPSHQIRNHPDRSGFTPNHRGKTRSHPDRSGQIWTDPLNHDQPGPSKPNHFQPPSNPRNPVFYAAGPQLFLHRPARKNFHQPPSVQTRPNRTEQPYGWISPQTAPAGSRITANLPWPSSRGPSTISPPSSVTCATLESRSSTLM